MKTKLTILALGIVVMVGSALAQTNQPQAPSAPGWRHARDGNALKLTDEQKKDVQKIKYDLMQKQIDLRAKIAHARLDYGQLTTADSPDEDAIAAKIDEISKLQVQLKKDLLDGWFAVNKILTPDQQGLWKKVLQHPGMARRHMMVRMQTNHRMGSGMMQMRRPGMGFGPMPNGGPTVGEGPSNDFDNDVDYLGPMADSDIFIMNDGTDDLDIFDGSAMDNMGMTGPGCIMGQGELMQNKLDMMKHMMDQNMQNVPAPNNSK